MALGEEKEDSLCNARLDLVKKLTGGLNSLFYRNVPFLPVYTAAAHFVQFGIVTPTGNVRKTNAFSSIPLVSNNQITISFLGVHVQE